MDADREQLLNSRTVWSLSKLFCLVAVLSRFQSTTVEAAIFTRRPTNTLQSRPATGMGSNIHRRFVLKRELQRQKQGYPVRMRGNILWKRTSRSK
ncbi:hypothetical protein KOR42_25510 [Thalassoglobus neptunius]|uniref:Uncharacterized protein n=1 Tax=Thalassoglobus neptunius TaxID=1938619 RepID=A0A5C5WYR9_9PLAN|nr:hypothetical protein KOR42_25510 [Thalassoglobus neptunius]